MKKITNLLLFLLCANVVVGQFGAQKLLTAQADGANTVFPVDLDGDGDLDLLFSSSNSQTIYINKVAWLENIGGGIFDGLHIITYNVSGVSSVFPIDLDNDGKVDVLSASSSDHKIAWYKNLGNGSFGPQQVITINASFAKSVFAIDLDNDGNIDVLSASSNDDKIAWYKNLGNGSFGPQQVITTNADGAQSVYASDLDNDGNIDVLSASSNDDKIAWYKNLGNGSFGPQQVITTNAGGGAYSVYASDLDNDGDMDVLSAWNIDDKIEWHENLGVGTFSPQQVITTNIDSPESVYTVDLDNDGDMDVLSASSTDRKIAWYENLGGGTFGAQQIITTNANGACFVYAIDIDNDNNIDVLSASKNDGKISWYKNTGGGVFAAQFALTSSAKQPRQVHAADIDNDGDIDILSVSDLDLRLAWYENLGGNRFKQETIAIVPQQAKSVYVADLDNDGDLDVLIASFTDHKVAWYENLGGGTFNTQQQVITGSAVSVWSVYAADLDNDGDMDVLSASRDDNKIAWYENLGGGIFGNQQIITLNANQARYVYAADIDNDGNIDVLSASSGDDKIAWYKNLGGGSFGSQQIITTNADGAYSVYASDLDNDGDMDVLSASQIDDKIAWYENLGGGLFGSQQIITINADGAYSVYASDLDNDGDMDLLSASVEDDKIAWYENLGGGLFGSQQIITTNADAATCVHTADLDNDGDMDVLSASFNDYKIAWYENKFISPFLLKGQIFYDVNQNGIIDTNEVGLSFKQTQLQPNGLVNYTSYNGNFFYAINDTTSSYVLSCQLDTFWNLTTDSITYNRLLNSSIPIADSLIFGFYPDTIIDVVNAEIIGGFPRCNDTINYWLDIKNIGTTFPSGIIHLQLHNGIGFVNSTIVPDSINGQNLYWHYDSLFYFSNTQINLQVSMPDFNSIGDTLTSYLNVSVIDSSENQVFLASDTLNPILVCAYDPNDKIADPVGIDSLGYISPNTNHIEYTIRFQNTGNDTALTVIIKDQLDTNLNWQSLVPLSSSHQMSIDIDNSGVVTFNFNNIMLPDSGIDFLGSQGYIKYKIDLKSGITLGTSIYNTAHIYFDQNPPVITNTKINTIYECTNTIQNIISTLNICENDTITGYASEELSTTEFVWILSNIYNSTGANFEWIADTSGVFDLTLFVSNNFCEKDTSFNITVNPLPNVTLTNFNSDTICSTSNVVTLPNGSPSGGVYSGTGVNGGTFDPNTAGLGTHSVIYTYSDINSCINSDSTFITVEQCVGIDDLANDLGILIYPNPNTGLFTIEKSSELDKEVKVSLLDATSRVIIDKLIPKGQQKIEMDITSYSKGVYYLQLTVGKEVFVKKILKN